LAHFNEGKIDVIGYANESGKKLTPEEIDSFLRANNHGRSMNKKGPNAWVGDDVVAMYHKEGGLWHLAIIAHEQRFNEN
jgi:hypothetical protein